MIIGDEILTGKVTDENIGFLSRFMFDRGIDLRRVEIITDDLDDISDSVKALSERVGDGGFVVTTGGIGPTHDDRTYEGVAAAFGLGLEVHEPTLAAMRASLADRGQEVNEARARMATLPAGCEVLATPKLWVPLCRVHNVYILPGIPKLLQRMLEANAHRFVGGGAVTRVVLQTQQPEGQYAAVLGAVAAAFPSVAIGSYPQTDFSKRADFAARITLEGREEEAVRAAAAEVQRVVEATRIDLEAVADV